MSHPKPDALSQATLSTQAEAAISAMEAHTGTAPGLRRAHGRGLFVVGEFQATPEARALTSAAHLQGDKIACLMRFSNASGNPAASDCMSATAGRVLGLGIRFELPSGGATTWAAATIRAFPARNAADFLGITRAQRPDGTPNLWRVLGHVLTHRHIFPALAGIRTLKPAASFSGATYCGVHTYFFVNAANQRQAFRYCFQPRVPSVLTPEQAGAKPKHFLLDEMRERLAREPAFWDLMVSFPEPSDPLDDATVAWPETRKSICLGRLRVDSVHPDQAQVDGTVFDPTGVPSGIELSNDPLLQLRASTYSLSYERRVSEPREPSLTDDMRR